MIKIKAFAVVHDNVMAQLLTLLQVDFNGELIGGYTWVGKIGVWNAVLITTTDTQLDTIESSAGNNALILVRMTTDERGELDVDINSAALTKINTWLTNRGYQTETNAPARAILRRLFKRFLPNFEPEQVDIN